MSIGTGGTDAARTLAEFGAEVIKINNPWEEGAGYRWQVHRYHTDVNRDKRNVLIDLKRAEGLDILWRLVGSADAFSQNLRLGVAERLGIGYEQVRARKPDIVYLSVSAFGYGGLWQYRPGYEPNAPLITGMQARMGGSADRPSGQPFAVNDYCMGLLGAFGLGLGLLHRPARLSRTPAVPGRPVSPPGGDAAEVLGMIGIADRLDELVEKRVVALA